MSPQPLWRGFAVFTMALLILGCDGSRNNPFVPDQPEPVATQTIEVSPSLGRIARGRASAFAMNGDRLAGPVTLGDDGKAELEIPTTHVDPVLIEVEGADDADYYDESAATTLPFFADQKIRALLPEPRDSAGVSILTELAVRLAQATGEDIDLELVELANERIRAALAEDVEDFLVPPVIVDGSTAADSLDDDDAGRLAARLGALAMLADGDASPALTVLMQLANDAADGSIDGLAGDVAIEGLVYAPATFASDFAEAIRDFADAFGSDALKTRAAAAAPKSAIGRAVAPGATEPGTVNPKLAGDYLLTYFEASAGGPYTEGETVAVVIDAAAGTLTLGGTLTLSDPFQRFLGGDSITSEINWKDPMTGFEYALSLNDTGVFNEINVGDADQIQDNGFPLFLGQLFVAEGDGGGDSSEPTAPELVARASFEGLEIGELNGQGDGTDDFGFASGNWINAAFPIDSPSVVDTSATPLSYSMEGGPTIAGGNRALSIQGSGGSATSIAGRSFATPLVSEFYFSYLFRPDAFPSGFAVSSGIYLRAEDQSSDYITLNVNGSTIDTGGSIQVRVASEGENAFDSAFGGALQEGVTFLLVGRLYKSAGSDRFDRLDAWLNPAMADEETPDITVEGPTRRQPPAIAELRFRVQGRAQQELLFDEFRFAGSWDGLFETATEVVE